jgi:hypothetical protein
MSSTTETVILNEDYYSILTKTHEMIEGFVRFEIEIILNVKTYKLFTLTTEYIRGSKHFTLDSLGNIYQWLHDNHTPVFQSPFINRLRKNDHYNYDDVLTINGITLYNQMSKNIHDFNGKVDFYKDAILRTHNNLFINTTSYNEMNTDKLSIIFTSIREIQKLGRYTKELTLFIMSMDKYYDNNFIKALLRSNVLDGNMKMYLASLNNEYYQLILGRGVNYISNVVNGLLYGNLEIFHKIIKEGCGINLNFITYSQFKSTWSNGQTFKQWIKKFPFVLFHISPKHLNEHFDSIKSNITSVCESDELFHNTLYDHLNRCGENRLTHRLLEHYMKYSNKNNVIQYNLGYRYRLLKSNNKRHYTKNQKIIAILLESGTDFLNELRNNEKLLRHFYHDDSIDILNLGYNLISKEFKNSIILKDDIYKLQPSILCNRYDPRFKSFWREVDNKKWSTF